MNGCVLLSIILFHVIEVNAAARLPAPRIEIAAATLPSPPKKWMTLTGSHPEVVAQGGYSGFFPDSTLSAYDLSIDSGIPGTILYCNVHFSKDNDGFCIPQINLANATFIEELDPNGRKTYDIYGQKVDGWFGLDYPAHFIFDKVTLRQNIFTRQDVFDGTGVTGPLQIKEDKNKKPTRLWLNIENAMFYNKHKISPERYLLEELEQLPEFISSPEIGFLKAIGPKLGGAKTKLIFMFLEATRLEPTTKTPYGSLVKNLPNIKSFACGIVVPKEYIWPVGKDGILLSPTNLVQDAHKLGLAVYASGFANDNFLSYNYSFDPAREYLQFVDNAQFSVDGVLSAFPSTASEAIGCLNSDKNAPREVKTLIISHNGASGDYPGATDLAYQKAIDDGADIIDCSVQMSKDGTAFCSDRPDLTKTTTATTLYMDLTTNVPEIQAADGIFSFDLAWSEIQSLKPQIESFFEALVRNPAHKNSGKFMTLSEFLEFAKTKPVPGVLINIKYASYLAKRSLDIVGTVEAALQNAKLDQKRVLIESEDSSVLLKFKDKPNYERILSICETIGGVPEQVAKEVKKYADAVFVHRDAIMVTSNNFVFNFSNTIPVLHAANVSVYIGFLKNEFLNLVFDYLSDPYVEIATLYSLQVDGFVTDFPATVNMFARSSCAAKGSSYVILPTQPGLFYDQPELVAEPPLLSSAEVVSPPLPEVAKNSSGSSSPSSGTPPPPKQNDSSSLIAVNTAGLFLAAFFALVTIFT